MKIKIKFIKEYVAVDPATNSGIIHRFGETEEIEEYTAQWLIDNGFAEEVKESGWWKPKDGEEYYFTDDSGCIKQDTWRNSFWQVDCYRSGNVFKTEEAVKRYWDYLKAIATVRQDEGVIDLQRAFDRRESVSSDDFSVYTIAYSFYPRQLVVVGSFDCMSANAIWFDTIDHADASLDKHPDQWLTIANYDWSRE